MVSYSVRLEIYARDGYKCYRCGSAVKAGRKKKRGGFPLATLDHFVPKCRGGSDDPSNLKTCCKKCNERKGAKIIPDPKTR